MTKNKSNLNLIAGLLFAVILFFLIALYLSSPTGPIPPPTDTPTITLTPTETLTPTITPTETITPTPTLIISKITDRPIDELTYCSKDILHPAGIRVIARWPKQNKRGLYISAQKGMGISGFRVDGWGYIPSTQVNKFSGETDSGICVYDAQWLTWSDPNSTDPIFGTTITIEFLREDETIVTSLTFSIDLDGLGLTSNSQEIEVAIQ